MIAGLAASLVALLVDERAASLHAALRARLSALAEGRAEVLATWLDGVEAAGRRLTESDLLRLFATEMALTRPGARLDRSLAEQLPYFQRLFADFAEQNRLVGVALLGLDGRAFLSSAGEPVTDHRALLERFAAAPPGTRRLASPVRQAAEDPGAETGLVLDVLLPVPIVQALNDDHERTSAALLVLTVPVGERLAGVMAAGPLAAAGERFRLIQAGPAGPEEVLPDPARVRPLGAAARPGEPRPYEDAVRAPGAPFAVGAPVPGQPWTVIAEIDAEAALAPLRRFRVTAMSVAGLIGLALVLAFVAFWWRRTGIHHRELATQYRALAERIQRQRRLLESITNAMREMLCLKTPDGRYVYVNPAFAAALGRPAERIVGRTDAELFGASLAAEFALSDRHALDGLAVVAEARPVELDGRRRHLSTSRMRVCDHDGRVIGLVAVTRDETELVEQRARRDRLLRQTVETLTRAIELRDPFLLGHTRRVRHYALAVGQRLGLGEPDLATLDLAASLSQIGKIFVPEAILRKRERHTNAEARLMRRHVAHALRVIAPIDFGLPVVDALGQMYERLDGSGYPDGLTGEQIGLAARVLGAVDVFCALTARRSHREPLSPGQALRRLANLPAGFDPRVVAALAEVVAAGSPGAPGGPDAGAPPPADAAA